MAGTWTHIDFSLLAVVFATGVIAYAIHTHVESSRLREREAIAQEKAENEARQKRDQEERELRREYLRQQKLSEQLLKQEISDRVRRDRDLEARMMADQIKQQEKLRQEKWDLDREAEQARAAAFQHQALETLKAQIADAELTIRTVTAALPETANEIKKYSQQLNYRQQDKLDAEAKLSLLNRMNPRPGNYVLAAEKWHNAIQSAANSVAAADQNLQSSIARQHALMRQQEEARIAIGRAQMRIEEITARIAAPEKPDLAPAP